MHDLPPSALSDTAKTETSGATPRSLLIREGPPVSIAFIDEVAEATGGPTMLAIREHRFVPSHARQGPGRVVSESLDRNRMGPVRIRCSMVGATYKILPEIETCKQMGVRSFIFWGNSHIDECKAFGARVTPELER